MPPDLTLVRRLLTLDAALATCSAGLVEDGAVRAVEHAAGELARLPALVEALFAAHGRALDAVAVTVGPGSFTGLRAALALAHGIGLAAGIPVWGVSLGAALRPADPPPGQFWTVIDSKRGRIFLERDGAVATLPLDALPIPDGPVTVAGDAAQSVASHLRAQGVAVTVRLGPPDPAGIARAVQAGMTRPPQPLYIEPPEARPGPPGRPAPA